MLVRSSNGIFRKRGEVFVLAFCPFFISKKKMIRLNDFFEAKMTLEAGILRLNRESGRMPSWEA